MNILNIFRCRSKKLKKVSPFRLWDFHAFIWFLRCTSKDLLTIKFPKLDGASSNVAHRDIGHCMFDVTKRRCLHCDVTCVDSGISVNMRFCPRKYSSISGDHFHKVSAIYFYQLSLLSSACITKECVLEVAQIGCMLVNFHYYRIEAPRAWTFFFLYYSGGFSSLQPPNFTTKM